MNSEHKAGLLILKTSIAIIVLGYLFSNTAFGHVIDCNDQTRAEVLTDGCPVCPKCPPVETCRPGYSCLPDTAGEQQQYPPEAAAVWIESLGCGSLIDVPIDSPLWWGREEGEVYARQNDECVVFYWPDEGMALFDMQLENPGRWHDYLLSGARPPMSGNATFQDGQQPIGFSAAGGGVTVFMETEDVPPPVDGFFAPYANPKQAELPANGIYPMGQRMPVSAYAASDGQLKATAAAGFTMMGPDYHGRGPETSPYTFRVTLPTSLGMQGYYRLKINANGWDELTAMMRTAEGKANNTNQVTAHINDVLGDQKKNDAVYAWYGFQEEIIHRAGKPFSLEDQRNYHRFVHDIIKRLDPKKRPYYISERRDSNAANMAGNACLGDGVMKQDALIEDSGFTTDIELRGIMRQWAIDTVKTAADADKRCPSYTGKNRAAIATLDSAHDPSSPTHRNEAWLRKIIRYDVYTQLAMGIDGFNIFSYGWKSHSTAALQQRLYNETLGNMIKAGLGKVFLWGDDRDDVALTITQGPKTFTWRLFGKTHVDPAVDMRNIQYGDHRYILLVNNSKETVEVRLSGIPTGAKATDLISGSGITPTIPALGVRMYKIVP